MTTGISKSSLIFIAVIAFPYPLSVAVGIAVAVGILRLNVLPVAESGKRRRLF